MANGTSLREGKLWIQNSNRYGEGCAPPGNSYPK